MPTAQRVLLVEGNGLVRRMVMRVLASCGCDVRPAATAAEAMHLLENEPFDAILADHDVGGGAGVALLHIVKHRHPGVRRILMSALPVGIRAAASGDNVVQHCLSKPFDGARLRQSLAC